MDIVFIGILTLAILGFLGWLLIYILYFSSAFVVWPPSIPTDRKSRRTILDVIEKIYSKEAPIKIADLGSGYGHLVRDISRNFKRAKVTGVELLLLPYLGGKILCKRFCNINIIRGDLLKYDFSNEDVIVFFFRTDHDLDKKFENEFKGKLVISNNFPLKYREADEVIEMKETFVNRKLFIYYFNK